ncbi:helix-turn-helix domain-containing protein [Crocosphaera sp. XPORK-15E]|uniref:helix-turn-helix domain-containing protein n=1 Tax=Crocosphaera sp. XPORK-15E TaxID=3110247 RepID=UPI002B219758|nr:helix-turn-helix domain-containing protein [Crocosphaera sp. XPORK-15E]MEA5536360.1 helix-turn-helix domain-containing protein [Crocosphaera sp. XPORK-15E]
MKYPMTLNQQKEIERTDKTASQCLTLFQKKLLLQALENELRSEYRRRIEIMLLADTGYSQSEICQQLKCCHETARYWIKVAQTGQAHHWNDHPIGRPKQVSQQYQQRLQELINHSPRDYGYSFHSWTAEWLSKHLAKEFGKKYSNRHVYRLLKKIGISSKQIKANIRDINPENNANIVIEPLQPSYPNKLVDFCFLQSDDTGFIS